MMLLDHLWQSTVFALAAGLLTLLLHRNGAAVRYGLWFAASVKFLIPFSLLSALGARLFQPIAPAISTPPLLLEMAPAARPFSAVTPVLSTPAATADLHLTPILLALWALGAAAILTLWLWRWARLRAALRGAETLTLEAPIPVKSSATSLEPGLIGILNPVLLLPQGIAERLSPPEMQAVLAHELCHLKRRDNLLAAIHMLVEALFWFYPLVWWLGARLIAERERACDEAVVESGNDPQVYAEGILKVCKFYLHSPLGCVAGVASADLRMRVETIMENRPVLRLNEAQKSLLAICALAVIAAPLASGLPRLPLAVSQAPEEAVSSPAEIARARAEQALPRHAIAIDPRSFDRYVGLYQSVQNPLSIFTISRDGGHFQSHLPGQAIVEIYPESGSKFFAKQVAAQLSFDADSQGRATRLVLHQGGLERPYIRISQATMTAVEAALAARIKANAASPGAEAAIRRYIAGLEKGQPAYGILSPGMVAATQQQLPTIEKLFVQWGPLKALTFKGVSAEGADIYLANFEHGRALIRINPLSPDGKIDAMNFSTIFARTDTASPSLGTEISLHRYIDSLEKGDPNYDEMTPPLAATVHAQLPQILQLIKGWGALKSITFRNVDAGGMDVYDVVFENGKAEWRIAPLTANGKVQTRNFRQLP